MNASACLGIIMETDGALYGKGLCKVLCKSERLKIASAQKTKRSLIACGLYRKKNLPKKGKVSHLPKQSRLVDRYIYTLCRFV